MSARTVGAVALGVGAAASGVALLAISGWLLSRAAEHPPVLFLMVAIVAVRACGLARSVLRYAERLVAHDVALRRQAALRVEVYRALASSTWVGRRGGDLLSRVVLDVADVTDRVVRALVPLCTAGVVLSGAGLALVLLSPAAGLAVLAATLVGAVVVPVAASRLTLAGDRALGPLRADLAGVVAEAAHAAPDVLAYGAAGTLLDRVDRADGALRAAEQRAALVGGVAAALQLVTTGAATTGALVLGAHAVSAGQIPAVDLAVLALTPLALHELVSGIPAALQAASRSRAALVRVAAVLDAPPVGRGDLGPGADDVRAPGGRGRVELKGLGVGWPGGPQVVTGLDLSVRAGDRVALVGPSGSGKTTVAATVLGLLPPRSGTVEVQGRVGYLAQDAYLFDTTIAENVRLGRPRADDAEVAAALRRVHLGLAPERLVGEHGTRVSGGEARRIALARLRIEDHDVVVVDEPTEHLDRPTADALMDDILALTADKALLVVTHDPALVARCDRVVVLPAAARQGCNGTDARLDDHVLG